MQELKSYKVTGKEKQMGYTKSLHIPAGTEVSQKSKDA